MPLEVQRIVVGPLQANCYLVIDQESRESLVVDPGAEAGRILEQIRRFQAQVKLIVLTHSHGDHIGGVEEIKNETGAFLAVHSLEADWIVDPEMNLSALIGMPISTPPADRMLDEGDEIQLGRSILQTIHTPGHSPGGLTLKTDGLIVCGDLIFQEGIGRTDLPGGDMTVLMNTIREKIYTLPEETVIHPGHGNPTSVGYEKRSNPFVKA